ncbi:hypothetical protein LARI1_G007054 [Lachnellula arida]|uniref:N-acetyltransferase domain-containing protein n=1 Tax=Lachnellula arida TaxID=1316785 RepID=A0A8T9B679_9HELO|nr:hypothetical protein LARI1_G007054 [Lachnellula arida]
MSNFPLAPASISDTNELGHLIALAYKNNPIQRTLMPFTLRGAYWGAWLAHDFLRAGEVYFNTGYHVCSSSKIVAFAKVRYPGPVDSKGDFEGELPEGTDMKILGHWFENIDAYHEKHASYEKDYCIPSSPPTSPFPSPNPTQTPCQVLKLTANPDLHVLCVHPSYQRQGLGKKLLTRFLADADKEHARVYLQATALGHPLYVRCGWVDVEDMVTRTPEGAVVWKCMMREPGAGE